MSVAAHPVLASLLEEHFPLLKTPGFFADRTGCGVVLDAAAAGGGVALVARTVGVGPKLALARAAGRIDIVGSDLVNRGVNEVLADGAAPQFFLFHGAGDAAQLSGLVDGIIRACRGNSLPLVHAEAQEGMGDAVVGTVVGAVAPGKRLDGGRVREGDAIFGLGSTGLHSEGYEVALPILESLGLRPGDEVPGCGGTVARVLLALHKSYRGVLLRPIGEAWCSALAHVARGGLAAALARAVPPGFRGDVAAAAWEPPPLFAFLARAGALDGAALRKSFNAGIGMIAVVPEDRAADFTQWMGLWHEPCWRIGQVAKGEGVRWS